LVELWWVTRLYFAISNFVTFSSSNQDFDTFLLDDCMSLVTRYEKQLRSQILDVTSSYFPVASVNPVGIHLSEVNL